MTEDERVTREPVEACTMGCRIIPALFRALDAVQYSGLALFLCAYPSTPIHFLGGQD